MTVHHGSQQTAPLELSADVVVVGSGPGGAIAAARLASSGRRVIVVEQGRWWDLQEFPKEEGAAYPALYQDGGGRSTDDLSITILQGRSVGGGSTVNWMTSLRTPESTLQHWRDVCRVEGMGRGTLTPHWEQIERRLNVHAADSNDVNRNNAVLRDGATALGMPVVYLPRNSRQCTNLGLCSAGCPTGAKQTAQLTYLHDALQSGAVVYSEVSATRLRRAGRRVTHVECVTVPRDHRTAAVPVTIAAESVFLAGGAINSPRLLLLSGIAHPMTGRRTWLHPVVATVGEFDRPVDPWEGSPQSIAVDVHLNRGTKMGYFIETPPLHPMLAAMATPWLGSQHVEMMRRLRNASGLIGLTVDGFDESERGGTVSVAKNGRLRFSYEFTPRLREAAVAAMQTMAKIQLAAGARRVLTLHSDPVVLETPSDVARIGDAPFGPGRQSVFTAHQMGGCGMSDDAALGVTNSSGRHHDVSNLFVCDGSLLPTGLGVNPMLTIYGVAAVVTERFLEAR